MLLAITAVGEDRPGIVSAMTGTLFHLGCNLEETTMTRLHGQFAMLMVVRDPSAGLGRVREAVEATATDLGLSLVLRELPPDLPTSAEDPAESYILRLYGADRPGIVHRVTNALAQRSLNITDLNTRVIPGDGGPVYVMLLEIDAPPGAVGPELREELARLREELGVEIGLEALEPEAL